MNPEEPSLLNHFTKIRSFNENEGTGVSTIIFAGRIRSEPDMVDALNVHRTIVEDTVNNEHCNITGILMGQGNTILHLLEGPCYSVLHILDQLSEHSHFNEEQIQSGRVIYCVEDRPHRLYPEWYSCAIQERKTLAEEVTEENCTDIVHDLASGLLEVGKNLPKDAEEEVELNRYADHLPGKSLILALASSEEFFELHEFVNIYASSYHLELESDLTWPLNSLVKY